MSNAPRTIRKVQKYRAIFLSDIHLGFKGCQADFLLSFLQATESEILYLVGDIFDGWEMKKKSYWPTSHQQVVNAILKKAATGTRVIYTPGNHDESARHYCGHTFDNIEVRDTAIHHTDRKSTRLNSSHVKISYAVFCLKKKTKYQYRTL